MPSPSRENNAVPVFVTISPNDKTIAAPTPLNAASANPMTTAQNRCSKNFSVEDLHEIGSQHAQACDARPRAREAGRIAQNRGFDRAGLLAHGHEALPTSKNWSP